ncbi:MAG: FkbM family methyltransferase [Deltaproteobacteria bacterium]|nr:FkbM family methyltransferase [Deltaproteobacteria bacterium]
MRKRRVAWWDSKKGHMRCFETKVDRGIKMCLYFDCELSRYLYCYDFETLERRFLKMFLRPGDIYIDIGANIGLFSLLAAWCVKDTGRVYAFEPAKKTYDRLCGNVALNRFTNVLCFQMAVSHQEGELPLFVSRDGYDAWNSFAHPIEGDDFSTQLVKCTKLDTFVSENKLLGKVTMVKIDVEGWEMNVLRGGSLFLSRQDAPVLQVEFTEKAAESAGVTCGEVYHKLEDLGYKMFSYDQSRNDIVPDPIRETYPYLNLIATKNPEFIKDRLHKRPSVTRLIERIRG